MILLDAHHHLDFLEGWELRRRYLEAIGAAGIRVVAQTLTPSSFLELTAEADEALRGVAPPLWSAGFHPWRIEGEEQAERELAALEKALSMTRFVGEIGLDHSPRRLATARAELQGRVLRRVLELACAAGEQRDGGEPVVLSIHSVRSGGQVINLLAEARVAKRNFVPVMHRFPGGEQELRRLVELGGCLSVHTSMLEGRRGPAAVASMPADRLLLESDLPRASWPTGTAEADADRAVRAEADEHAAELRRALAGVSALRGEDAREQIARTQERLYGVR
ncbi:D-aminoacyl-tRNA deacylase [Pseudoclavibacter triregionum]|nr:D-aminoacyl-tRNA deacylase [Pseudoclavibacter triregionum]